MTSNQNSKDGQRLLDDIQKENQVSHLDEFGSDNLAIELQLRQVELDEQVQLRRLEQDYQARSHRDVLAGRLALVLVIIMGMSICAH